MYMWSVRVCESIVSGSGKVIGWPVFWSEDKIRSGGVAGCKMEVVETVDSSMSELPLDDGELARILSAEADKCRERILCVMCV